MMKKKISRPICIILCSEILETLLYVLHNPSSKVLLPWQHTGFQTSPILKTFLATFGVHFHICKWCLICIIQQAYKYVSSSLWSRLTCFQLNNTNIWKSSGWGLEKSELPWEHNFFYSRMCVFSRTISLLCFNGLRCQLAKIAVFTYLI